MVRERLYVRHHQEASPWMPLAYLKRPGFYQLGLKSIQRTFPTYIHLTRKHDPENIHPVMLGLETYSLCV